MRQLFDYVQGLRVSISAIAHNSVILCSSDAPTEPTCCCHTDWREVCDYCAFTSLRGPEALNSVKFRNLRGFAKYNGNTVGTTWGLISAS